MSFYRFYGLILEVSGPELEIRAGLPDLLSNLSCVRCANSAEHPDPRISIRLHDIPTRVPDGATRLFHAEGFAGFQEHDSFYLSDGSSVFHIQSAHRQADAFVAPSFFDKPALLQYNFWTFGLLKLLRPLGIFSLHAAGLVRRQGRGMLLVGASGTGKSTLALGLIRNGSNYLTDDAVVLQRKDHTVTASALRKDFYIDAAAASTYSDLILGTIVADKDGGTKRRVCLEHTNAGQQTSTCVPQDLVFTRIVPQERSALRPLDSVTALKHLLDASGPQLFDRQTMRLHLDVLKGLLKQAACFQLSGGLDLYHNPLHLLSLLDDAREEEKWSVSSSS